MEFLVSSMEHHYLGTGYLFGTGGAVLAAENTHYLLFHRIGQPYLYVQAVESSFLLSQCPAAIPGKALVYLLQEKPFQQRHQ